MFFTREDQKQIDEFICNSIKNELILRDIKVYHCTDIHTNTKLIRSSIHTYSEYDDVYYVMSYPTVVYWIVNDCLFVWAPTTDKYSTVQIDYSIQNPANNIDAFVNNVVKTIKKFGKKPFSTKLEWWKYV